MDSLIDRMNAAAQQAGLGAVALRWALNQEDLDTFVRSVSFPGITAGDAGMEPNTFNDAPVGFSGSERSVLVVRQGVEEVEIDL